MKIPQKNIDKKDKVIKKERMKPRKEQVLVVAQEIRFARLLSGNEKKGRDKVLRTLKKWLLNCFEKDHEFKEDDFVRIWKGLFYAVWMSDKPLIQEELCENISAVLDLFPPEHLKSALLMYKAGLRMLATEWYGIDEHRMDKFLMLVRRYLRASLRCLQRCDWSLASCKLYARVLSGTDGIFALKTPRYARNATSMLLHIMDCYLEEIAKVSGGSIPDASLVQLLRPVCAYLCGGEAAALCCGARRLLTALLRQSPAGLRYQEATRAWQKMGCPEGGPEALELVSDEEDTEDQNEDISDDNGDDSSEKPLDPRAGRVDVELPLLPVPANLLADMLRDMLASANSKAHKRVRICLERFEKLARDEYPMRIKTLEEEESPTPAAKPKKLAQSLHALEKKLVTASDELALRGLNRKHRKRLLAKSRSGLSIVEEVENVRQKISNATNGSWQVEPTEPEQKKDQKQNTQNKETKKRKNEVSTTVNKVEAPQKKRKTDNSKDVRPKTSSDVNKQTNNRVKHNSRISNKNKIGDIKTDTPKKVKFELKKNSMQAPVDYYKSIRQSPQLPFDGTKRPSKTNLKPSTPSPINPFYKKKMKLKG